MSRQAFHQSQPSSTSALPARLSDSGVSGSSGEETTSCLQSAFAEYHKAQHALDAERLAAATTLRRNINATIAPLQAQLAQQADDLVGSQRTISDLFTQRDALRKEVETLKADAEKQTRSNQSWQKMLDEEMGHRKAAEANATRLQQGRDRLEQDLELEKRAKNELVRSSSSLQAKSDDAILKLDRENSQLQGKNKDLESRVETLDKNVEDMLMTAEAVGRKLREVEEERDDPLATVRTLTKHGVLPQASPKFIFDFTSTSPASASISASDTVQI